MNKDRQTDGRSIRLLTPNLTQRNNYTRLSCNIDYPNETREKYDLPDQLWFEWENDQAPMTCKIDPFVIALIPICGKLGFDIESPHLVSEKLLHNLYETIAILESYFPKNFRKPKLLIQSERRPHRKVNGIASFFSGGIDSLYNIAEIQRRAEEHNCEQVKQLWIVQGLDISLENSSLWKETAQRLKQSVRSLPNARLTCARTNIRHHLDNIVNWTELGFGPALAAISNSATSRADKVLIGSMTTYNKVIPHASTPLLDPLWSSDEQDIVHFSSSVDRIQKIKTIFNHAPHLLEHLRVCWMHPNGEYNCGVCEKCLRTMAALEVCGCLSLAKSIPSEIPHSRLRQIKLPWEKEKAYSFDFWEELLESAIGQKNKPLASAIADMLSLNRRRRRVRRLCQQLATALPEPTRQRIKAYISLDRAL